VAARSTATTAHPVPAYSRRLSPDRAAGHAIAPLPGNPALNQAVNDAVASTVPLAETSRAPSTLPVFPGAGLPQEPYPPASWNDPIVVTRPSLLTSWHFTTSLPDSRLTDMNINWGLPE
jgi:hypothetical protein